MRLLDFNIFIINVFWATGPNYVTLSLLKLKIYIIFDRSFLGSAGVLNGRFSIRTSKSQFNLNVKRLGIEVNAQ